MSTYSFPRSEPSERIPIPRKMRRSGVLHNRCKIRIFLSVDSPDMEQHLIVIKPVAYLDFLLRRSQIPWHAERKGNMPTFAQYKLAREIIAQVLC